MAAVRLGIQKAPDRRTEGYDRAEGNNGTRPRTARSAGRRRKVSQARGSTDSAGRVNGSACGRTDEAWRTDKPLQPKSSPSVRFVAATSRGIAGRGAVPASTRGILDGTGQLRKSDRNGVKTWKTNQAWGYGKQRLHYWC